MAAQDSPAASITEIRREREVLKYEPFLYEKFTINNSGEPRPSCSLSFSPDHVLTSLAQLGAYQTDTDRGTISLFDTKHQFFFAEGVLSQPVIQSGPQEHLRVQGTAIPRRHGACEHILSKSPGSLEPTEGDEKNTSSSIPVTVIPDLWEDPRFRSKPNCRPCTTGGGGGSARFYAAAPIRTAKGINIGVYCVTRTTTGGPWDGRCAQHMRDMVRTIMEHLEATRSTASHRRNARLIRGMGSFIEGKSTISGWQQRPNAGAFTDYAHLEGDLDSAQQRFDRIQHQHQQRNQDLDQEEEQEGARHNHPRTPRRERSVGESPARKAAPVKAGSRAINSSSDSSHPGQTPEADDLDPSRIMSKASNIIRESFEVEGCCFFDVSLGPYEALSPTTQVKSPGEEHRDSIGSSSDFVSSPPGSSEDEKPVPTAENDQGPYAALLGYSTTEASSINAAQLKDGKTSLPKSFLSKLLKRYPRGRIFNFDAVGELQTSESSEDDTLSTTRTEPALSPTTEAPRPPLGGSPPQPARNRSGSGRRVTRPDEGVLIHRAFPSARSVAFVPVWDFKKARWFAGSFIYTHKANRIFTVEGELSFLTAFSTIVAADLLSLEALQADKAKSDALGSLSHELRSPLHGVILGTELLNDTDLSVFQENAAHIIETCSRTLLDTLDHLLDYSKVNSLAARRRTIEAASHHPGGLGKQSPGRDGSNAFGRGGLPRPRVQIDRLVEDVTESMFSGFQFQHKSIKQIKTDRHQAQSSSSDDAAANSRHDTDQAVEQLGTTLGSSQKETLAGLGSVAVNLAIDPSCQWAFDTLPGGVRRIFMNVLGNALKYTSKGSVVVSLTQETVQVKRSSSQRVPMVKFKVQDTGRGIGADFLRHDLFKAFSQEDDLSPGTGLGLSIVKTITSQMRGKISVRSQLGEGTTITILLPLEHSMGDAEEDDYDADEKLFEEQVRDLTGLRLRLHGFEVPESSEATFTEQPFVQDICTGWLHMEVVDESEMAKRADVTLWSQEALPASADRRGAEFSGTANVVICHDALEAYRLSRPGESAWQAGVFEFISQPVGPRKLARAISLAFQRWSGISRLPETVRPSMSRQRSSSVDAAWLRVPPAIRAEASTASDPTSYTTSTSHPSHPTTFTALDTREDPSQSPTPDSSQSLGSDTSHPPPPQPRSPSPSPAPPPKPIVLLVDDNPINLKVLCTYMKKLGHEYLTAADGQQALDTFTSLSSSSGAVAAVVMDMSMPVMDGFEATRRIREHERRGGLDRTAVLALTGLASDAAHQNAVRCGVDVFLTKPIKLAGLKSVLEEMNVLKVVGE